MKTTKSVRLHAKVDCSAVHETFKSIECLKKKTKVGEKHEMPV